MQLDSIATVAPLFTAGAALIVGGVTWATQRGVARDRIRWEGKLEVAKFEVARFETTLEHFIEAADAGDQYMDARRNIDVKDYEQRREYVFAILGPIRRARVEAHALPDFPGIDEVKASIKRLESLTYAPSDSDDLRAIWDPKGIGDAITLLSKGRSAYMHEVTHPKSPGWRKRLPWRSSSTPVAEPGEQSSGVLTSDITS
ncbi:hypothetical protein ACH444_26360 [Streptomyces microflavus]|uniref:hypothetical protein n=1 Tax=Streptomyces TaxID=1883 RepID=UPI001C574EE0|nr:hypothetical protein [Streptomyces sp. 09ZI22]MBW3359462.1 hypothetical protein [Streptomyces sp. 09ZI22]